MAICGQCGKTVKDDAKFCGGCGAKRTAPPAPVEATADLEAAPTAALVCPTCGKPLAKPGATFCGSCGAKIEARTVPVPPPQAAPPAKPTAPVVAPPPPPVPAASKMSARPPASPPVPGAKKKGSPILMILVIVFVAGFVILAAVGVGGYLFWKKAKAKAAATLAEVTQQAEKQAQDLQAQAPETPQETPPEPTPSPIEPAPSQGQEMAQATRATPSEPPTSSRPKPKPPVASGSVKPVDPTQDVQPDQVRTENLDKPLLAPAETSKTPAAAQAAVLGLILESRAPGTRMVVKVDGTKIYEEDMPATKAATRIAKEFPVAAGAHHIRVAVWRPPQEPVAGEWDFTFEPGSHPVFRLDLKSNWNMEVKRFQ